jgi:hypothetical protein
MQDVPALLASLHGLSAFDDQGDFSRDTAEAHERAERARQQRERKEQQELDRAAALRLRQFQQKREEDERRRVMEAEVAKARQEKARQAQHAAREYERAQAQQRPTTSRGLPPVLHYNFSALATEASDAIEAMIVRCAVEMQEVQDQRRPFDDRIAELTTRSRRLKEDLATKRREEAL